MDTMSREIWMPHAGHFICGNQCQFHLTTYVNGYIVSTVGEYVPDSAVRKIMRESRGQSTDLFGDAERADFGFEEIGHQRTYETMVFHAVKSVVKCCPYEMKNATELEMAGYTSAAAAYAGHLNMLVRYGKKHVSRKQAP